MAQGARAVRDARVEDAAVVWTCVVLRHAVQQDVHVRADVHMGQLQRAREREHQRDVLPLGQLLTDDLDVGGRAGGQAAGKGRVAVDVELEQVEVGVGDEVDGAVDLALGAVVELEGFAGLVADGEGDPFELVVCVFDVFAGVTGGCKYGFGR